MRRGYDGASSANSVERGMDTTHDRPRVNERSRCRGWINGWQAALGLASMLLIAGPAGAQVVASPHAIDIPRWFSNSLLDFKDEIPEAAREGKRVMVYFGQDGCPYCKALMKANFGPGPIADKTRKHFVAIAINIWGDADVTWIDGTKTTEKELARMLKVQFTPTLLFFETDGQLVLRLNGYLPPERFTHVLDYVIAAPRPRNVAGRVHERADQGARDSRCTDRAPT